MTFPALATVLDDLLYAHAHYFGAVESIETRHSTTGANGRVTTFVSMQFTTDEAAGLFYRWVDGLSVEHLVRSYWRERRILRKQTQCSPFTARETSAAGAILRISSQSADGSPAFPPEEKDLSKSTKLQTREEREDAWWDAFAARVADGKLELVAKLAPHDARCNTGKLLLGPNVMISTPLVTSLFTGLFCATQVEYDRTLRGFLINFSDADECRLTLHALQGSLKTVFGVALSFR